MLTIDRLSKIDSVVLRIIPALYRSIEWVGDRYEALIVNAAYKVAEAKAVAIGKAESKISDLEDDRDILRRKYRAALDALAAEIAAKEDKINAGLAAAAEELVAATKAYDQTVSAAYEKLGVGVEA